MACLSDYYFNDGSVETISKKIRVWQNDLNKVLSEFVDDKFGLVYYNKHI